MTAIRRTASSRRRQPGAQSRIRFKDVLEDYERDVAAGLQAEDPIDRHRALQRKLRSYDVAHLRLFFGRRCLTGIRDTDVTAYVLRRQDHPLASNETINEELWTLGKIYRFATSRGLLTQDEWPRIEFVRTHPRPVASTDQPLWKREEMNLLRQDIELRRQQVHRESKAAAPSNARRRSERPPAALLVRWCMTAHPDPAPPAKPYTRDQRANWIAAYFRDLKPLSGVAVSEAMKEIRAARAARSQ